MKVGIHDLYAVNYSDRRKQEVPVSTDRRSGLDRRQSTRPAIDSKLQQDFKSVKSIFDSLDENFETSKKLKSENEKKEITKASLSSVPVLRKISGIKESFQDDDKTKAFGKLGLMAVCMPDDIKFTTAAAKQILGVTKAEAGNYQIKFSFFRNTLFEPLLKKLGSFGKKLYKADKTLFDITTGRRFLKKLGLKNFSYTKSNIDFMGNAVQKIKLQGSFLSKLIGKSMLRIPVLSILTLSILEIPSILKAFSGKNKIQDNLKNGIKQILKSGINVGSLLTGSAVLGAIGNSLGPAGSLIGLGVGSYLGSKTGNALNNQIDKI